jgi:hypothetical protein
MGVLMMCGSTCGRYQYPVLSTINNLKVDFSCSGFNDWGGHPVQRVTATISQFRKGVGGIRSCEITLAYNDFEQLQALL